MMNGFLLCILWSAGWNWCWSYSWGRRKRKSGPNRTQGRRKTTALKCVTPCFCMRIQKQLESRDLGSRSREKPNYIYAKTRCRRLARFCTFFLTIHGWITSGEINKKALDNRDRSINESLIAALWNFCIALGIWRNIYIIGRDDWTGCWELNWLRREWRRLALRRFANTLKISTNTSLGYALSVRCLLLLC